MSSTLKMLRDDLRDRLDELDARQWTDAQLSKWINEGARDLTRRTECLRDRWTTPTVIGTQEYTGPTDLIRLHRVEYQAADDQTHALEYRDFQNMDSVWWSSQKTAEGTPLYYTTWGMPPNFKIVLFPTPAAVGTIRCFYYRLSATALDDTTTVEVPEGWEDAVVTYAEMMAMRRDGNPAWQESKGLYEEKLSDLLVTAQRYGDQAGMIDTFNGSGGLPGWLVNDGYGD